MSEEKNDRNYKLLGWSVGLVIVAVILLMLFLLFRGSETYISENEENVGMEALYCEASGPESAFFISEYTSDVRHEIKVILDGDKPYKISYNYYGSFADEKTAETASASLHADYNIYMGERGVNSEILYPTFVATGSKLKINLYAEKAKLNATTAVFFFMDADEASRFTDYNSGGLKKLYERKGFECEMKNN